MVTLVLVLVVLLVVGVLGLPEQRDPKLRGLRVAIGPDVPKERCREVVANIKVGHMLVLSSNCFLKNLISPLVMVKWEVWIFCSI